MKRVVPFLLGMVAVLAALLAPGLAQANTASSDRDAVAVTPAGLTGGDVVSSRDVLAASDTAASSSARAVAAAGLLALGLASVAVSARRRAPRLAE